MNSLGVPHAKDAVEVEEVDYNEFYDWQMIPKRNSEETKTGVTFKGDSDEYIAAQGKLYEMMNKKGLKYFVNGRQVRILDNAKNKPFKVEVKPLKGSTGKVNLKIYNVNAKGAATIMISKVSDGELCHVKALAFKIIKYLLDGIIDNEIGDKDIESYKNDPNMSNEEGFNKAQVEENLKCDSCEKSFKTKQGLNIHKSKIHYCTQSQCGTGKDFKCEVCDLAFKDKNSLGSHAQICQENVKNSLEINKRQFHDESTDMSSNWFQCDACEYEATNGSDMKRHRRDKHDVATKSTSPKPKKRRQLEKDIQEEMEVVECSDNELDDERDVLLERSKMQDDKMRKREQRLIVNSNF